MVNAATGEIVTQSASFGDTTEDAALFDPPPGDYVAHIVNYDQVQDPPDDWTQRQRDVRVAAAARGQPGQGVMDADVLRQAGQRVSSREVVVERGQKVQLGNACRKQKQQ